TKAGLKRYEYPRYMFKNESGHILGIFTHACQLLAIDWRWDGTTQISIARRESVAKLDSFVGPKF
ncbi:MAG: transcriptional regulator, partial [Actinomycetota bacterium]